jgi:two-component SAPR family response regulator
MKTIRSFIIIDDDLFNNKICSMMITRTLGEVDIKTFSVPEEGLAFIESEYNKDSEPTILFLDLNMPTLTGWEFMEHYEKFSDEIKQKISIYIVSSSVDQHDKDKANSTPYIKGFISKPLLSDKILSIVAEN